MTKNAETIRMDHRVDLYIPSQCICGGELPEGLRSKVIEEVKSEFDAWFGSHAELAIKGDWRLPDGTIAKQEVADIYSFCKGEALEEHHEDVDRLAVSIANRLTQDRVLRVFDNLKAAQFTDDTQMSVAIAEALINAGEKDIEEIMEAVKEEFIKWYHHPETPSKAPGRTCLTGVGKIEQGIHWSGSGVAGSKGCGSAMRAAPIGYLYQHDPEKLKEVAHATGICTHGHPTADAACIGAAYLVKLALDGVLPEKMIPKLLSFTEGISEEFDGAILKIKECLDWDNEEKALNYLGEGWVGEEAVASALYCFLKCPEDYEKVVIRAANTNGDSDSIACIGGSISGAYLGVDAIPLGWIERIEKTDYLDKLARRLTEKKGVI